jgi:hypothetical protein
LGEQCDRPGIEVEPGLVFGAGGVLRWADDASLADPVSAGWRGGRAAPATGGLLPGTTT